MKVLVCDDERTRCAETVRAIRDAGQVGIDVTELVEGDLTAALTSLFDGVTACLADLASWKPVGRLTFDDADIVILDNNLAQLRVKGVRLTAESIAGYVRAFTNAAYVVSLNKNPDVDFDLRYLVGDYTTRADLALNTQHLSNPALWTGKPSDAKDGFLPWYWPRLLTVSTRRRSQIDFVENHFDNPVFGALGFPEDHEALSFLSLHARGALAPDAESGGLTTGEGKPLREVTFRDVFIARDRSLPARGDRATLSNADRVENTSVRSILARSVAADIDLWFRRDVLGPQEELVDVPHLLMRFPFLLGRRANDIGEWNKTATATDPPFSLEQALYTDHVANARFAHDIWVPSPSFWWPRLKADEKLNDLFFAAKEGDCLDGVFCEDRSAFFDRSSKNGQALPTEFSAEFEGSWGRRYVARIAGVRYAPRSRFAV